MRLVNAGPVVKQVGCASVGWARRSAGGWLLLLLAACSSQATDGPIGELSQAAPADPGRPTPPGLEIAAAVGLPISWNADWDEVAPREGLVGSRPAVVNVGGE